MTTARTRRPETQLAVEEVAPQRPCSRPAPGAAVTLLAVAVLVAACDSRESVSFTWENATDRFNSLVAARAADRSDRRPDQQGVDSAPASPSWTTPEQPPSLALALTDGLPSELEFSVGARSVRHVSTRTDALRVGVDGDIVAWTRPEPDSSGTLHFSLFHNPELLGHGDDADLWPAAVALEALRSFLRPSGTRFGIVVSLLDISTSSHAAAVPWVYPRTGNDPRTAATTAYAADRPQLPLLVADRPGWVVAVLPPAGRDPSHSDDLLPLHLRIYRFLSSLRARSTPPPYSDVIASGVPIQVLDTYFPPPGRMDTAAVKARGAELARLFRSIETSPTEQFVSDVSSAATQASTPPKSTLYWLLGVLIPLAFGACAVKVVLVDLETRQQHLHKAQEQLESWWHRHDRFMRYQRIPKGQRKGGLREFVWRCKAWFVRVLTSRRYFGPATGTKEEDAEHLKKAMRDLSETKDKRRSLTKQLLMDLRSAFTTILEKGGGRGFLAGLIATAASFLVVYRIVMLVCDRQPELPSGTFDWLVILFTTSLAIYGIGWWAAGRHKDAYMLSVAVAVYLAVNTVELSALQGREDMPYDSQTVNTLFGCFMTLFGVRSLRRFPVASRRPGEYVANRILGKCARGEKRERGWKWAAGISYGLLLLHFVYPACAQISRAGLGPEKGLLAVTTMAAGGLAILPIAFRSRRVGEEVRGPGEEVRGPGGMEGERGSTT